MSCALKSAKISALRSPPKRFDGNAGQAGKPERAGTSRCQINNAAMDEWPTIIDADNDAIAPDAAYLDVRTKRHRLAVEAAHGACETGPTYPLAICGMRTFPIDRGNACLRMSERRQHNRNCCDNAVSHQITFDCFRRVMRPCWLLFFQKDRKRRGAR